jgi:ADP-heptose:LPS heptosyltransferase
MKISFQRAVDRYLGVPLCAALSLLERLRRRPAADVPPRRILVILLSEMGSLVLAHPMFARLRERYPEAAVHVLLFRKNREVLDLLGAIPRDNVLTLDDGSAFKLAAGVLAMIGTLRARDFDVVIDCELFARISAILAYLSGARTRIGFHRHTQEGLYRGSFINRRVLYNPYRHLSQQFLTMAAAIESTSRPVAKLVSEAMPGAPPALAFDEGELAREIKGLHADFPSIAGERLVLVYPSGGILPIRAWPMEHYRELCSALLDEGYAIGVIGLKDDKPYGEAIARWFNDPRCVDLTGYTRSVRHLLAVFRRALLLVTNDGGPAQFSVLARIPTIVMFGPETPALYGPLGDDAHSFHLPIACSPCLTAYNHRDSPCDGDNQCLKRIGPTAVLARAREMLAKADPSDPWRMPQRAVAAGEAG